MTTTRRRRERHHCRKRRFRDHKHAIAALHHIVTIAAPDSRHPVRAYYCDRCRGYHLTSQPAWTAAA